MSETNKLEDIKNNFPYLDILYVEHPTSKKYPRQPISSRAAQFSPFDAVDGYFDEVKEKERVVEEAIFLDEDKKELLDYQLSFLFSHPNQEVLITYFLPDDRKEGGEYRRGQGRVQKIDTFQRKIFFSNSLEIAFDQVVNIDIIGFSDIE